MKINFEQLKKYENIELLARQLVEGFITGLHKSPFHGFSVEFAEHKPYNIGESTKHIDWKIYAKTDRLFTKQYEEETNLRCHLVVDNSLSMHYPTQNKAKITFSVIASACISYMMSKQRDAVSLTVFSDQIESSTPVKSTPIHIRKIFSSLEKLLDTSPEGDKTNVAEILHQIAEKAHKRSLIVIFSDMFSSDENTDDLFSALQHLKYNKHEVLLFHVTDINTERDFQFENRPYEFIDLESGEKLKLQPENIRDEYKNYMVDFYKKLKLRCAQVKIDFIEADVHQDINKVLNAWIIKRTRMH